MDFLTVAYSYFLLSISITTMPTTIIAMMMPMTAGTKYRSAADCGIGVGAAVGSGSGITVKADSAYEGQYPLLPSKVAITLNLPGISGVHS